MHDVVREYIRDGGNFYHCGRTWPVPDVTDVLIQAVKTAVRKEGRPGGEVREYVPKVYKAAASLLVLFVVACVVYCCLRCVFVCWGLGILFSFFVAVTRL